MFSQLDFRGSPRWTVGAEVELQILDPKTGDLAPGALRILDACKHEGITGVCGEFLLSMIEVKSDVCEDVSALRDNLLPRLWRVCNIAKSLGYGLAFGGTHPVAKPTMAAIFPAERYQRILRRQGSMAFEEAVFGLHVHVGVPDGDAAISVINRSVQFLPHLLTLSANSPFWQGIDTDCVSVRMRMFRPTASAGIPMHFKNWTAFCDYCQSMNEAGLLESTKDIYWDIRPQPKFGTVEFRIFDVPSTLSELLGLAALTRCLVVNGLRSPETTSPEEFWLANENKWLATRYGREAHCVRQKGGARRSISTDVTELIDELGPIAEELGETAFLSAIDPRRNPESCADRQRRIFRETGDWRAVVADMQTRWIEEIQEISATADGRSKQELRLISSVPQQAPSSEILLLNC